MIQTFAELKRALQVNTELKLVWSEIPNHKYLNTIRKIEKVQSNGVRFEGGSWLGLGMYGEKANDFKYTNNGFLVTHKGEKLLEYKFV